MSVIIDINNKYNFLFSLYFMTNKTVPILFSSDTN